VASGWWRVTSEELEDVKEFKKVEEEVHRFQFLAFGLRFAAGRFVEN
jgi:hypothetical protein